MRKLKVCAANVAAIETLLASVNNGSREHTLRTYTELAKVVEQLEDKLIELLGTKKHCSGARAVYTSGKPVALSYSYKRRATEVELLRLSGGWYLTSAKQAEVWPRGGGDPQLYLLKEQDRIAVERLRATYITLEVNVGTDSSPPAEDRSTN